MPSLETLSLELLLTIVSFLRPRCLAALSRTSHLLHARLASTLHGHALIFLYYPCNDGSTPLVRVLLRTLDVSANSPATNAEGNPLHAAIWSGHVEIVAVMLEHRVDIERDGGALSVAARALVDKEELGCPIIPHEDDSYDDVIQVYQAEREVQIERAREVLKILLKAGADVTTKNREGQTVVEYLRKQGPYGLSGLVLVKNMKNKGSE